MESLVGRRLGKYELTAMIGGGGMATVYQARHPGLGQQVAVKILHPFLSTDTAFIDRFRREAHAVAALRHPNIVRVLDFDHEDELYYMVMEYIGGPTLSSAISARRAAGGLSLPEIRRIFPPLCNAVDYAAGRGMIHRDIKPANILMSEDGEPILTDYGIAKMIGSTALTSPGTVVGSAHYMSPEQAQGYECDIRSDLYSLGIVLFEALSGTVPFDGDTTVTVLLKHISAPIPSIRALRPNLPPALEMMLARALAKQPQDRYEMGDTFADELLAALRPTKTMTVVGEPVVTAAAAAPAAPAPIPAQPAEPETPPPAPDIPPMPPEVTPPAAAPPTPQAGRPAPETTPPASAAAVPVMPLPLVSETEGAVDRLSEVGTWPPAPPAPPETPVPASLPIPDGATRVEMTRVEEQVAPVAPAGLVTPVAPVSATEDHVPLTREVAAPAAVAPAQLFAAPEAAAAAYTGDAATPGVTAAAAAMPIDRPAEFQAQSPSADITPVEPPPVEPPPVEPPPVPPPAAAAPVIPARPDQTPGMGWTGAPTPAPAPLTAPRREPGRRNRMWVIIAAVAVVVIAAGAVGTWLALKSNEDDSTLSSTTTALSTTSTARPTTTSTVSTTTSTMSTTTTQPTTTTIATTTTVATTTTTARPTTTVRRTTTTARATTTAPPTTSPPDTIGPGTTSPPDTIGPG